MMSNPGSAGRVTQSGQPQAKSPQAKAQTGGITGGEEGSKGVLGVRALNSRSWAGRQCQEVKVNRRKWKGCDCDRSSVITSRVGSTGCAGCAGYVGVCWWAGDSDPKERHVMKCNRRLTGSSGLLCRSQSHSTAGGAERPLDAWW